MRLLVPPAEEPVSLAEAKAWLRVDSTEEDALIEGLLRVARETVEHNARRQLVTARWLMTTDSWPCELAPSPFRYLHSISYLDLAGERQVVDPATYRIIPCEPAKVVLSYGQSWPTHRGDPGSIEVQMTSGYGGAEDVPQRFKTAISLLVANWHEQREPVLTGSISSALPFSVEALIAHGSVY